MNSARAIAQKIGWGLVRAGVIPGDMPAFDNLRKHADLRGLLRRLQVNCVVDVGANKGFYARSLRNGGFAGEIVCFEPIREDFCEILGKARGDARWRAVNVALSSSEGTRSFNVLNASWGGSPAQTVLSSFLSLKQAEPAATAADVAAAPIKAVLPSAVETRQETVTVRRLDQVLPEVLGDIARLRIFLKMDTQGHDLEVFKGCTGILDRVVGIQSEISVVPIYDGMPHYTAALEHYEAAGFSLMNLHVVTRTSGRAILEYDCLMAKADALDR
jgi:FkbM family methyltransferase